jgi:hypothetical protein
MPDVGYVNIPKAELDVIKSSGAEAWFSEDLEYGEFEKFSFLWEETAIFTLTFISALSEDDFVFRRVTVPGISSCLYFLDSTLVTGSVTIAGLGDASDATAIKMYLRIADYMGEALPNRICTAVDRFKAGKSEFMLRWREVSYYRENPDLFQEDYDGCAYEQEFQT